MQLTANLSNIFCHLYRLLLHDTIKSFDQLVALPCLPAACE
jgi:hypothetical protein